MNSVPTDGTGKVAIMAKQLSVSNEQILKLQAKLAKLQAMQAEQQANEQQAKKDEHEFAKFVVSTVQERLSNNIGFSGEPVVLMNAEKLNSSFGGEVVEILNGYNIQGVKYIACNKYSRYGEFIGCGLLLADDVFIEDGQLYINDVYGKNGAIPHKFKKFENALADGTEVHDLRTYENVARWNDLENKRIAKNEKIAKNKNK